MKGLWVCLVCASLFGMSSPAFATGAQEAAKVKEAFERHGNNYERRMAALQDVDDESLQRLLLSETRAVYFTAINRLPLYAPANDIEYALPRLHVLDDYDDLNQVKHAYLDSLVALNQHDRVECMRYTGQQGFTIQAGFSFPFRHHITYTGVALANGEVLELPNRGPGQRRAEQVVLAGDTYCYLAEDYETEPSAVHVDVEFRAQVPTDVVTIEFTREDVGRTIEQDGYLIAIEDFRSVSFAVQIDAKNGAPMNFFDQDIVADARDSHGHYLAHIRTERAPSYRIERIDALLGALIERAQQGQLDADTAAAELAGLREAISEERGQTRYLASAFNGPVDTGRVTLLVYADDDEEIYESLQVPVQDMPISRRADTGLAQLPDIPVTAPVYHQNLALRAERKELTPDEIAASIETTQWLMTPYEGDPDTEYPGRVAWYYPMVQSDVVLPRRIRMFTTAIVDTKFYDADGNEVVDPAQHDLNAEKYAFEINEKALQSPYMIGRVDYAPSRFSGVPVRIAGTAPVVIVANLDQQQYAVDALPEGMTFENNRLVIDYSVFTPRESNQSPIERKNHVFARDEQGYLAEITHTRLQGSGQSMVEVYYFYGRPEYIEIWYPGEIDLVDYAYDVQLD